MPEILDAELLAGFESNTLAKFGHEEHLRVVYLLILEAGPDAAVDRVSAGIRAMALAKNKPEAFHATRTVAWTRLVAAAMQEATHPDSLAFLAANPDLARRDLLDDYYATGRLGTAEARLGFVEPDRSPQW